jgi:MFS family permease
MTPQTHLSVSSLAGKMTIIAMGLGFALTGGDPLILSINLTAFREGLALSGSQAVFLAGLATLTLAAGILGTCTLGDILGKRRLYIIGLTATILLGVVSVMTPGFVFLAVARGLLGLAFALVLGLSLAIIGELFPANERARAISLFLAVAYAAAAPMALIGSLLVDALSWRWGLAVAPLYAVIALLITFRYVPETPRSIRRLDVFGMATAGTGLVLILYGVSGLLSGFGLAEGLALGGGAVTLLGFVLWEARSDQPALDIRLFASRPFTAAVVGGLAFNFCVGSGSVLLGYYASLVRGWPTAAIGWLILAAVVVQAAAAAAAGSLSRSLGQRLVMIIGLALLVLASLSWLLNGPESAIAFIFLVPLLGTVGNAFVETQQSAIMLSHAPRGLAGSVAAVKSGTGQAAYSLGPVVATLLVSYFYVRFGAERIGAADLTPAQVREALRVAHGGVGHSGVSPPIDPGLVEKIVHGAKEVFTDAIHANALITAAVPLVAAILVLMLMRSDWPKRQ